MKKRITIRDVADLAGVSVTTVSHAISGKRAINVDTKHRIFEVINKLDYRPDFFASSIKRGASRIVGIVARDIKNPINAMIISALSNELQERSYQAFITISHFDLDAGRNALKSFSSGIADGVINLLPQIDSAEAMVLTRGVPTITHLRLEDQAIVLDFATLTRESLEYLWGLGHRKIGLIAPEIRFFQKEDPAIAIYKGFYSICDHPYDPAWIFTEGNSADAGEAGAEKLYKQLGVTAIITVNDLTALAVYRWASRNKVVIPDDLSVIGFDDIPASSAITPSLTTARYPFEEIAHLEVEALIGKIENKDIGRQTELIHLPLIIRNSTGPVK